MCPPAMITEILLPLAAVAVAELGDKTQLSILLLSSKTERHLRLLLGVVSAFFIVDGIAVLVGSWLTNVVSVTLLRRISGILFIAFGALMLREGFASGNSEMEGERGLRFNDPLLTGFTLIFLTEWGDKTQVASAVFATQYNAVMVLTGTMIALTSLTVAAIYLGKVVSSRIDRRLMSKLAGLIFIVMGISLLLL